MLYGSISGLTNVDIRKKYGKGNVVAEKVWDRILRHGKVGLWEG